MAEENEDLDLDVKPASGSKKTIIIMALVGVLLIGASVGATLFFISGTSSTPEGEATETEASESEAKDMPKKPLYLPLETMVVNFADPKPAKYLQVDLQLMAYDPAVLIAVEENMPVVRNDILVLLGSQSYDGINSREGKEALRGQIVGAVNGILKRHAGIKGKVQAIYFTSFVMQ